MRILRTLGIVIYNDLKGTISRPKTIVALVLVGLAFLLSAWAIAHSTSSISQSGTPPTEPVLWAEGASGAFATLTFGVAPLLLPLLPVTIAYDALERDRKTGFLEMALSRPVSRAGIALGKYISLFVAVGVPVAGLCVASAVLIESMLGEPISNAFLIGFVSASLLLIGLYLSLSMVLTTILPPGSVLGLTFLLWIGFNAVSSAAFIIGGQFFLILPVKEPSFQATFSDLISFTGFYLGLIALFIPPSLNFVIWPGLEAWQALAASWAVAMAGFPWLGALTFLYVFLFQRIQVS